MNLLSHEAIASGKLNLHSYETFVFRDFLPLEMPLFEVPNDILAAPFDKFIIEIEQNDEPSKFAHPYHCYVVNELQPGKYEFVLVGKTKDESLSLTKVTQSDIYAMLSNGLWAHMFNVEKDGKDLYEDSLLVVNAYLRRLYEYGRGSVQPKPKRLRGKNGKKRMYTPKSVTYIYPAKTPPMHTKTGETVRHLDAWRVRAHWRRLSKPTSLGLDRNGVRQVEGYTWVGDHQKGPDRTKVVPPKIRVLVQ